MEQDPKRSSGGNEPREDSLKSVPDNEQPRACSWGAQADLDGCQKATCTVQPDIEKTKK